MSFRSPLLRNTAAGRRTTVLLLGTDDSSEVPRADVALLLSYDPAHRIVDVVFVPQDVRIAESHSRYRTLGELFASYVQRSDGNRTAAAWLLANTLGEVIGSSTPIRFDYVAVISYDACERILELIEPVNLTVTEPLYCNGAARGMSMHFDVGTHQLRAAHAMEYVRYRDASGEVGKIERYQQFLRALIARLTDRGTAVKLPFILWRFHRVAASNMSLWDLFAVAVELRRLSRSSFWFSSLVGRPHERYPLFGERLREALASRLSEPRAATSRPCIVKVYNASGVPRVALRGTEFLRSHGYDVIDWATWWRTIPHSRIIDRTGNPLVVRRLAALLNISDVHTQLTAGYAGDVVDVMVILGEDSAVNDAFRDGTP